MWCTHMLLLTRRVFSRGNINQDGRRRGLSAIFEPKKKNKKPLSIQLQGIYIIFIGELLIIRMRQ